MVSKNHLSNLRGDSNNKSFYDLSLPFRGTGGIFTAVRKKKNIVLEEVLVENYAAEGKSLARRDGKVIFIENAVPGDVVDVRLLKNKKEIIMASNCPLLIR